MAAVMDQGALRELALFQDLTPEELAKVSGLLHRTTFPAGTNIMTVDQPGEVVYIIASGTVKIHVEQADGTDVILGIRGAGETVGEMSLLDSHGRSASVETLEESTFYWMDRPSFRECLQTIAPMTFNLARMLASRLRLASEQIQALAALDVYGRVARQVLAFAQQYGTPTANGGVLIPIRLTQSDIAGLVGASRERVNQVIASYKQGNYISIDQNYRITVLDPQALASRCQ